MIHGQIRSDVDPRFKQDQKKKSNNYSQIVQDTSAIRNPINGVYDGRPAHRGLTAAQHVGVENRTVPPLKSLGAVRHEVDMDRVPRQQNRNREAPRFDLKQGFVSAGKNPATATTEH